MGDYECCATNICYGLLDKAENKEVIESCIREIVREYYKALDNSDRDYSIHLSHLLYDMVSLFTTTEKVCDKLKIRQGLIIDKEKWYVVAKMVEDLLNYHSIYSQERGVKTL